MVLMCKVAYIMIIRLRSHAIPEPVCCYFGQDTLLSVASFDQDKNSSRFTV